MSFLFRHFVGDILVPLVAIVCIVCQLTNASERGASMLHRHRRAVVDQSRVFVIRQTATGDLFNLSSPVIVEQFRSSVPIPGNLTLSQRGVVSLSQGSRLKLGNFTFNVTANGTAVSSVLRVVVFVVDRSAFDPIFANSPLPLWATCPVWIRPGTTVFQVQAIDLQYGANVTYRLESGGDGKFDVDPVSGSVFVVGRQMFETEKVYRLAISAQIVGMISTDSTPTQVLSVKVGSLSPQFSLPVYNISFVETQTGVIYTVVAESFQNLPLTYSMTPNGQFRIDSATGEVSLVNKMEYRRAPVHLFNFNVTVKEGYSNFVTTTTMTINLLSANNPPFFQVEYYVVRNISEDVAVGTSLLSVLAYDFDPGAFGQINCTASDDNFQVVKMNDSTFDIRVAKELDYDLIEGHRYEFNVTAIDGGNLNASATVQVWMKNVSDEAPWFEPSDQVVIVREGAKQGLTLTYIQAFDPDGDDFTFRLNGVSPNGLTFRLDPTTGLLTLGSDIPTGQRNSPSYFNLSVTITDNSAPPRSNTSDVGVRIQRVNTQPVFAQCRSYNASIPENSAPGTLILTMAASDEDVGDDGKLVFTIIGNGAAYFNVSASADDPKVAELHSRQAFDRENPPPGAMSFNGTVKTQVTVKVQDRGIPDLSTNCILLVTIDDVNDNAPTFDYSSYRMYTPVGTPGGSRVIRVFATDKDFGINALVSYSLSQACQTNLVIDAASGWITAKTTLNTTFTFTCQVTATDGGTPSKATVVAVQISVSDRPDDRLPAWLDYRANTPIDDVTDLFVNEDAPIDSLVANLKASGTPDIRYFLANTGEDQFGGSAFGYAVWTNTSTQTAPNNDSMAILVKMNLDSLAISRYYLRCRAYTGRVTDGVANIARLQVNVRDVNNRAPLFLGMDDNGNYPASVSTYTRPNDAIIYVTAVDLDRDWPNNQVSYSFDPKCAECSDFSIDAVSGLISAKKNNFDPRDKPLYTLKVIAKDGSQSRQQTSTGTVDVRVIGTGSGSPAFSRNFTTEVSEGSAYNTTILNAVASYKSDIAQFDQLTQYAFYSGNDRHRFAVDPMSGRIYSVGDIFYPQQQSYTLGYRVFDGTSIATSFVTIAVRRSRFYPPIFGKTIYTNDRMFVEKSRATGSIAKVSANSADGSNVRYSLSTRAPDYFSIDANTGDVTLVGNVSRDIPDGFPTWQVNVVATDGSGTAGYALVNLVLVDINDHSPTFDTCCLWGNVSEDAPSGTPIWQLRASDPDNGINGTVTFRPVSSFGPFSVSPSGIVSLKDPVDYAAVKSYTLNVQASDGGGRTTDQEIVVNVLDANNNPPRFANKTYFARIPEEMELGSYVLELSATDADEGINAQLTYSISSADSPFRVDSILAAGTGVIKIAKKIDFESTTSPNYSFNVIVRDPNPQHTDTATITIVVYGINDDAPVFDNPKVTVNISESSPIDQSVTQFSARDAKKEKSTTATLR